MELKPRTQGGVSRLRRFADPGLDCAQETTDYTDPTDIWGFGQNTLFHKVGLITWRISNLLPDIRVIRAIRGAQFGLGCGIEPRCGHWRG
jgi:hypothetical protein